MQLLSKYDQLLLLEIYCNAGKITKKEQKTFNCKFYNSIGKLIQLGLIRGLRNGDNRTNTYYLTDMGKAFGIALYGDEKKIDYMVFIFSNIGKKNFDVPIRKERN